MSMLMSTFSNSSFRDKILMLMSILVSTMSTILLSAMSCSKHDALLSKQFAWSVNSLQGPRIILEA